VSDYHSGGVSEAEHTAVEAHLATCTECQQALSAYRRLYTLARSPLQLDAGGAEAWAPYRPFTEEETMTTTTDPNRDLEPTRIPYRQPPTALKTLGAIAAVLLVGALIGVLLARQGGLFQPAAQPTPTPTVDPQAQAYVAVLRTYWRPLNTDEGQDGLCGYLVQTPTSNNLNHILTCRPNEAKILSDAQALATHLTVPPPAGWQRADSQLKQAVQALVTIYTGLVTAIDARDFARWNGIYFMQRTNVLGQFCAPMSQIDAGLPYDQQMPPGTAFMCGG
jgi:hypothetical protein